MSSINFPIEAAKLLEVLNVPDRLKRHLTIVHSTCFKLLRLLKNEWPNLIIKDEFVLFGAAIHDIGKAVITNELYESGNKHEQEGFNFLIKNGCQYELARFAKTHGDWRGKDIEIEDLLVTLSYKIWKGKRIDDLEMLICKKLSKSQNIDYWEVYVKLDRIISRITLGADNRLSQQDG
ncbi:MAG: phosphohydrolase [Bacteroidota bacterium]